MSNLLERKNVIKVKKFLNNFDEKIELIVLDETARTAKDAAKSLKREVGAIVKSLLFKNIEFNEFYLCLVSGDKYMSLQKLSKIIGNNIVKANADECKQVTGFSIGGVSPVAHLDIPSRIFIDENFVVIFVIKTVLGHQVVHRFPQCECGEQKDQ